MRQLLRELVEGAVNARGLVRAAVIVPEDKAPRTDHAERLAAVGQTVAVLITVAGFNLIALGARTNPGVGSGDRCACVTARRLRGELGHRAK